MISDAMSAALSEQYTRESYSSYLYMSMASYFDSQDLVGFANWMQIQAREEAGHALILFRYLCDQGSRLAAGALDAPPADWENPVGLVEEVVAHERSISKSIHDLAECAMQERDHMTLNFLQWFIEEQVEEEASANSLLGRLKIINGEGTGVLLLDSDLQTRVYTVPTPLQGVL